MASSLFRYQGCSVIAMQGHGNRFVVYLGDEVVTVVRKIKKDLYQNQRGQYSTTLTDAVFMFLEGAADGE